MIKLYEESARCLLCENPKCTQACSKGFDPARMVRAVRFENNDGAAAFIDPIVCGGCTGECESACIHYDKPVRIREMSAMLPEKSDSPELSLSIDFLGLKCENPFFLSSSIVAGNYDMVARAFRMGWAGAVYKTIGFLRPEEVSPRFDALRKEGTPFIGFKNLEQISDLDLNENLNNLRRLKQDFPEKIVVASIMGQNVDEWSRLAELVTEAGVDIIECNFSCPHMSGDGLGSDVGQNPELVAVYTKAVRSATHLPILAKMTPNIGNMELPAIAAVDMGADGLAAINTVKSILAVGPDTLTPAMDVKGKSAVSGYSGKAVKPIALRFINDMAKCERLRDIPISGMGGIETWADALDFIALGSSNIQITTAVMQYGYRIIDDLIDGLKRYMRKKGVKSVRELVGSALGGVVSPDRLNRDTVVYPQFDLKRCVGCGRCEISCQDAGHSAITTQNGKPRMRPDKCVGCQLCQLVCPLGAISTSKRVAKEHKHQKAG